MSEKGKVKRPPWSTEACELCGNEGLASRAYPTDEPYVCEACELYQHGFDDGRGPVAALEEQLKIVNGLLERTDSIVRQNNELRTENERLQRERGEDYEAEFAAFCRCGWRLAPNVGLYNPLCKRCRERFLEDCGFLDERS